MDFPLSLAKAAFAHIDSSRALWTIFLADEDQQQINQPEDQAGGYP